MADPNFLTQEFTVKLQPAHAISKILEEIMKFTPDALLTSIGEKEFQIKADIPDHPGVLSLEMESDSILANFDYGGYCLRFSVEDWYERLKNSIFEKPYSAMSIKKSSESTDVHCLFGEDNKKIELGKAEFIERVPVHAYDPFIARLTMGGIKFRSFIEDFSSRLRNGDSALQLRNTPTTLCWVTPRGNFHYSFQKWGMTVYPEAISFQFGVRWDRELFEMLRCAAIGCDIAELTVFENAIKQKLYRFRFIFTGKSYHLSYVEQVPT